MSASKSIVGLIVGALQRDDRFDVGALVAGYMPELANSPYRDATIRDLIDMRTDVVLDETAQQDYGAATGWEPIGSGASSRSLQDFFERLTGPAAAQGGPFRYVSASIDLVGLAIERATGQSFASLVSDLLWKPIGAERDAYVTVDRAGSPRCTGGLCMTARDLARVGQLVLDAGRCGSTQVVPEAWIADIASNGDRDAWKQGEWAASFASIGTEMSYRSGWYVIDGEPKTLFAMGIHGQNLFVIPSSGIVIAKLSSQASFIDYEAVSLTHRAVTEILRCITSP